MSDKKAKIDIKPFSDLDKMIVDSVMTTGNLVRACEVSGYRPWEIMEYIAGNPILKSIVNTSRLEDMRAFVLRAQRDKNNHLARCKAEKLVELDEASELYRQCNNLLHNLPASSNVIRAQLLIAIDLIRQNKLTAASNILFRLGIIDDEVSDNYRYAISDYLNDMYITSEPLET